MSKLFFKIRNREANIYFFFVSEEDNGLNLDDINSTDIFNLLESLKSKDWIFSINFYNLLKNILSQNNLRIPFLILIKEKIDNLQYDIVVPLIENFIWKTNEKEINFIFKDSLSIFHEIFFALIFAEKFKYYHDIEMWRKIGKSISSLIKNKIHEKIIKNDIDGIDIIYEYNLFNCLNEKDLISVFNHEEINFIKFLLENTSSLLKYINFRERFYIEMVKKDIGIYMNDAIINLIPNFTFNNLEFLITPGFFEYLHFEHIKILIENPKVDYLEILEILERQISIRNDGIYPSNKNIKKILETASTNFFEVILLCLKNNDYNVYSRIIKQNLWDFFELEDFKNLIKKRNLNFIENLLIAGHKLAIGEIEFNNYEFRYIIPQYFINQEKEFLKIKIKELIIKQNMNTFVPLYADGLTRYFNDDEICSMIRDQEINLLKLVLIAIDKHEDELYQLYSYRESSFDEINNKFFEIVKKNIKPSLILDLVRTFTELNFSALMEYQIIEKMDYYIEKLKQMIKNPQIVYIDPYCIDPYDLPKFEPFVSYVIYGVTGEESDRKEKYIIQNLKDLMDPSSFLDRIPESSTELTLNLVHSKMIPAKISKFKKLTHLFLIVYELDDLPPSFKELDALELLIIHSEIGTKVPSELLELKSLKFICPSGTAFKRHLFAGFTPDVQSRRIINTLIDSGVSFMEYDE